MIDKIIGTISNDCILACPCIFQKEVWRLSEAEAHIYGLCAQNPVHSHPACQELRIASSKAAVAMRMLRADAHTWRILSQAQREVPRPKSHQVGTMRMPWLAERVSAGVVTVMVDPGGRLAPSSSTGEFHPIWYRWGMLYAADKRKEVTSSPSHQII